MVAQPANLYLFDPATVSASLDLAISTSGRVASWDRGYRLVLRYVAKHLCAKVDHQSFDLIVGNEPDSRTNAIEEVKDVVVEAGIGLHKFSWRDHTLHCLHQRTDTKSLEEAIVLFAPSVNCQEILAEFVDELVKESMAAGKDEIAVFHWGYSEWQQAPAVPTRSIESVVLPREVKTMLLADVDEFVSDDSKAFYAAHCIPFKRSYLFHGPPGSGKSSLIQALASHYGRSLFFLELSDPSLTDRNLRTAIQTLPKASILVFEDVDAAFNKARKNMVDQSNMSFSGLLNALDGIGRAAGHIVVLTTNFLHELDSALVRKGRVDIHVEFTDTTFDQMADMFLAFYSRETPDRAAAFARALTEALGPDRKLSMAGLQHYFVAHRRSSADDVIADVGEVAESIDGRKRDEDADRMEQHQGDDDGDDDGDDESSEDEGSEGESSADECHGDEEDDGVEESLQK